MSDTLVDKRVRYIERQRALRAATPDAFAHAKPAGTGPTNRHGMPNRPASTR
jgi:hypothetical protein